MDLKSYSRWYDYSRARDAMFAATDTAWAPWYIARTDDKKRGRADRPPATCSARSPTTHPPPATSGCPDASQPTATPNPTSPCTTSPHRSSPEAEEGEHGARSRPARPRRAVARRWSRGPGTAAPVTRGQRWLARLAFIAALAAAVVLLLSGALKSLTALPPGAAGLAIICARRHGRSCVDRAVCCAGSRRRSWLPRQWP